MAQRWDADRRQWVDDGGTGDGPDGRESRDGAGRPGGARHEDGAAPDGEQWWAAATQAGVPRPDAPPAPGPGTGPGVAGPPPPREPWPADRPAPGWSPPVPQWPAGAAPAPGGGRAPGAGDSRRLLPVIVAVAVLAGGLGGGLWALTREGTSDGGGARGGPAGPAVTVTATPGAPSDGAYATGDEGPAAAPGSPAAPAPPPGYSRVADPLGYSVDVPVGWVRARTEGKLAPVVTYTAPGGDRRLMVFEVKEVTAAESSAQAQDIAEGFAGYRFLDRRSGADWSEFSYRYDSRLNGVVQTVDHRFRAADGTPYAIVAGSPAGTDLAEQLRTAVDSFCPRGADCRR